LDGFGRILIVRVDKIGDVVLATPCIRAAKESWPQVKVSFLAHEYAASLLEENPFLDEIIIYSGKSHNELKEKLKIRNFDAAVMLWGDFFIAWAIFASGIPLRAVSGFKWYQFLFNKRVYLRRSRCEKKEWEYNLDLMKLIGCNTRYIPPELYLKDEEKEWAEMTAEKLKLKKPLIGVYPGGGAEIRWPKNLFAELCHMLKREGFDVIVLWGPGEKELAYEVAGENAKVSPSTNIRQLMALINHCDAIVANNTGPMHIAAALKKPLVQIFDPRRSCNPKRWGHEGKKFRILKPPVEACKKCHENCKFYNCMEMIPPKEVFCAVKEVLTEI